MASQTLPDLRVQRAGGAGVSSDQQDVGASLLRALPQPHSAGPSGFVPLCPQQPNLNGITAPKGQCSSRQG